MGGFRRSGLPLRFGLPLGELVLPLGGLAFGLTASEIAARRVGAFAFRFGVAAGRVRSSAFRFGNCPRRVGLRAHCFRFSARTTSELPFGGLVLPLGGLAFGLIASAFRHAPLRRLPSAGWFFRSASWSSDSLLPLFGTHRFGVAAGRVGLRAHCFRFSACTASEWLLGEFVLPPSASELRFGELAFGLTASAFRHAPIRTDPHRRSEDRRSTTTQHLFHFKHLSQHVNLPHRSP